MDQNMVNGLVNNNPMGGDADLKMEEIRPVLSLA